MHMKIVTMEAFKIGSLSLYYNSRDAFNTCSGDKPDGTQEYSSNAQPESLSELTDPNLDNCPK